MEAGQPAQLTGTNRSNALDPAAGDPGRGRQPKTARAQRQDPPRAPRGCPQTSPDDDTCRCHITPRPATPNPATQNPATSNPAGPGQPGGHGEGPNTRSHPELGRENPQRRWYCISRCGRVGRRQARPAPQNPLPRPPPALAGAANSLAQHPRPRVRGAAAILAGWSSPVARQAHNLKVVGSNPTPATNFVTLIGASLSSSGAFAFVAIARMPARRP